MKYDVKSSILKQNFYLQFISIILQPLAPVKVRADMLRTQIADIELMKHRMATKDEEIIELKKKLLMKVFCDKHDITK